MLKKDITKSEIKLLRSLGEKKFREETGLFTVEGEKMVREAEQSDFVVRAVWRKEDIGEEAMSRISQFSTPSPVLALVEKPGNVKPEGDFALALDAVRDPGNLGTIIRIADWFGVRTVYMSADTVEAFNPKVIQSSMGSIFRIRLITCDIPELCRSFKVRGLPVYGTLLDGQNIYSQELEARGLIVMGNESNGISPAVRAELDHGLLIPQAPGGGAESLNVAVATAVTLSEFRRSSLK